MPYPIRLACASALILFSIATARAGDVEIVDVKAVPGPDGWRFDVTLLHEDTGWDHYADAWRVVGPDGQVYGTRTLAHPHVDEQPFTRSLSRVAIPQDVTSVTIEAHDSVHGWSPMEFMVSLDR
ncbi:MAG: hypothetical protein AAFT19_07445 [Pseudomonadota bacterium]